MLVVHSCYMHFAVYYCLWLVIIFWWAFIVWSVSMSFVVPIPIRLLVFWCTYEVVNEVVINSCQWNYFLAVGLKIVLYNIIVNFGWPFSLYLGLTHTHFGIKKVCDSYTGLLIITSHRTLSDFLAFVRPNCACARSKSNKWAVQLSWLIYVLTESSGYNMISQDKLSYWTTTILLQLEI